MSEKPMKEKRMNEKQTPEVSGNDKPMAGGPVSMDCAAFEKISQHLYRPEAAEAGLAEAALAHAESCSHCAALLTEVEWLEFSLRDLARHDANRRVSPRVESALLQEFRLQKAAAARRQIRWRLAALGVAAAGFLALGFSLHKYGGFLPRSPATPAPHKAAPIDSSDSEYATAFVELPYADDSAALDGGAIVRVSLSRSALISLGLPVDDFAGTDPVEADLVVGVDGTPEAIRLVSQVNPGDEF